ncbi:MAG: excinuclease ABC subunit UvrA, partial [Gammaproteobacteria bacterium]|nr:excinuclease ABC subunit UvrA [Gammaproteobacteria bacterium]
MENIHIRGARTHNLKNIDLTIPRNKLVVITGLSGSGKSSLAFDTLYAEGQRRYVESLSAYARQFLSMMEKPDVDSIEGLSPAISIQQKSTSHNPRSTVGTITEIYDYLRLLYARVGEPRCPQHNIILAAQSVSQMVDTVLAQPEGTLLMITAPIVQNRKGEFVQLLESLRSQGFIRARINNEMYELDEPPKLDLRKKHTIDIIVDRFKVKKELQQRLAESFETALQLTNGIAHVFDINKHQKKKPHIFSNAFACPHCGYSLAELEPRLFSFNNPVGACSTCDGLGVKQFFDLDRVIHDPKLSLSGGAIRGWDHSNSYYFHLLSTLANHYGFDIEQTYHTLPKKFRDVILYGSGDEAISFTYVTESSGKKYQKTQPFEGVIPNMERRYRETDSSSVREFLNKYLSHQECPDCHGARLCEAARHVFVKNKSLTAIVDWPIEQALIFFQKLKLTGKRGKIAEKILKEVTDRLSFLNNVGLNYLTLSRSADTLSGGEAQRIRLASQIGSGLVGVMYILDEPSIGLHQRDNQRLLNTLFHLRDLGNTVLVVEHDEEAIRHADHVIDIGPGAGVHGGQVVAQGSVTTIKKNKASITGQYLSGKRYIAVPKKRSTIDPNRQLTIVGASGNNLQNITVDIPVGVMTCITGVSGSGKSTLINHTLYPFAAHRLNKADAKSTASHQAINGIEYFDKVVDINQSPIGRTPRSNPATYTGMFTPIRELFTATPEARARGYKPGRFSFNVEGGRCEACQGDGL